ncbi:MAG: hypothetical protein Ta2B_15790 [Termitinemataceae bacterium]|nr:MAG: hypothetical protein Ta2B_15790 [Termitinemataceae bacterium]
MLQAIEIVYKRELKVSFGNENPDKTFYIIRCGVKTIEGTGLFAIVMHTLTHIAYATEHGWVPVVDLQNIDNQYLDANLLGKENAWEYFFLQPMDYTLKDIQHSKNIVISRRMDSPRKKYYVSPLAILNDEYLFMYYKNLFKNYIRYTEKVQSYLDSDYNRILKNKERVLGVLVRGTDYTLKKAPMHHIQPDFHEVIKKAQAVMESYTYTYIYIATESQECYDLFKNYFGEKLLDSGQKRYSEDDLKNVQWLSQVRFEGDNKVCRGFEYLSTINMLSKCTSFIGGLVSPIPAVYFMADKFEYDFIYELGFYPPAGIVAEIKRLIKKYFCN